MLKSVFRFVARMAFLAVLVYLARSALERWIDGPEPSPTAEPWAPATEPPRAAPPANVGVPPPPPPPLVEEEAPRAEPEPVVDWVAPDEGGAVPSTHPVKVKLASKLYREPGSAGYDRCRPDRCYTSAAAAEADGFVRAKR